ncbi:MAG: DinB family protein [Caldilineaceae bacterium]
MNNAFVKTVLGQQFGAAIDMFGNTISACPDELWQARLWPDQLPVFTEFWYLALHTLFWLDLYLSGAVEGFAPPPPFTLDELDPVGVAPATPYTKAELQTYLNHCRCKCQTTIAELTDERAQQLCRFPWGEVSFGELQLYNMRHVQEHAAQLSMFLGQERGLAARWVTKSQP